MGFAVVGGYVYRGKAFTKLQGYYIFGDFVTGYAQIVKLFMYFSFKIFYSNCCINGSSFEKDTSEHINLRKEE